MKEEKTPIPLRASRKQAEPQPLTFPQPDRHINVKPGTGIINTLSDHTVPVDMAGNPVYPTPLVSPVMRDFIHQEITKALYAIGHYDPEPNIVTMSYEAFEAFMMQVWEDE